MKKNKENQEQINQNIGFIIILSSLGLLSIILGLTEAEGMESILYTILGIVFISLIFVIFYFQKKKESKELEKEYLKKFYEYLAKNNSTATVIGFSTYSGLPPEKAREIIENFAIKTGISPEIDDNGLIYYRF